MNTVDLLRTLEDEFYESALCAGRLEFAGGSEPVEVLSLSAHSADLRCGNEIVENGTVTLAIDGFRSFEGELVRRHGRIIGIVFGTMREKEGTRVARGIAAADAKASKAKRPAAPATVDPDAGGGDTAPDAAAQKRSKARSLRGHTRSAVFWSGALQAGRQNVECIVLNMSPGGAKIRLLKRFVSDGSPVILHIDRLGGYTSEVVWLEGNSMGLRFLKDPKQIAVEIEQGLRKPTQAPGLSQR
jgi:hypothetical protein